MSQILKKSFKKASTRCIEDIFEAKETKLRKMMCHPLPDSYTEWYLHVLQLFQLP